MTYEDLDIGMRVTFTFAGSHHEGNILSLNREIKHNQDVSRYTIEDEEGFRYPVAVGNVNSIIL